MNMGKSIEYNTLARDIGVTVNKLKRLTEALMAEGFLCNTVSTILVLKENPEGQGKKYI